MNKLRLWVLVLAATGILTGCDSCGGDTGITFAGDWQNGVDQANLTAIKNAFEREYPDINIIEVRANAPSGGNGRVGDTIILSKTFINTWPAGLTPAQDKAMIDPIYANTSISRAREAPRSIG
jgi:hypothetical protein